MNQINLLTDHISKLNRLGSWQSSSYRFLCPYCQSGTKNSKGRDYRSSEAKGYIFKGQKASYDYWIFKCQKTSCVANKSFLIEKLIQDHCPELLTGEQKEQLAIQGAQKFNPADQFNQRKSVQVPGPGAPQLKPSAPVDSIQKLPRSTPQHQAGKGSILDQRLKQCKANAARPNKWERQLPPIL